MDREIVYVNDNHLREAPTSKAGLWTIVRTIEFLKRKFLRCSSPGRCIHEDRVFTMSPLPREILRPNVDHHKE